MMLRCVKVVQMWHPLVLPPTKLRMVMFHRNQKHHQQQESTAKHAVNRIRTIHIVGIRRTVAIEVTMAAVLALDRRHLIVVLHPGLDHVKFLNLNCLISVYIKNMYIDSFMQLLWYEILSYSFWW
jgi:hypothetical protein